MNTQKLSESDIKELKINARPNIIVGFSLFLIGALYVISYAFVENSAEVGLFSSPVIYKLSGMFLGSILVALYLSRKIIIDLKGGNKILEPALISSKKMNIEIETGHLSKPLTFLGFINRKKIDDYSILVENRYFRVSKDFYEKANEGDEIFFHLAPKSEILLKIELSKK